MRLEQHLREIIRLALAEDIASGDITSRCLIPESQNGRAKIIARQPLRVCGQRAAQLVCEALDKALSYEIKETDGSQVDTDAVLALISGPVRSMLAAERTILNFMQRLSGIATLTAEYVAAMDAPDVDLLDTRKTTPGWRFLEKYAVGVGGGTNHRFGLYDAFLIKNNHIDAVGGDVTEAVERCRAQNPDGLTLEVEVRDAKELAEAVAANPDVILLDNMSIEALSDAVRYVRDRAPAIRLEASGGVTRSTIGAIAKTGVDAISVGALTHSATAVDISLRYISEA